MSDTPRTDARAQPFTHDPYKTRSEWVDAIFARKLERECDQLAKQCVRNVEEIGQLRVALEKAECVTNAAKATLNSWKQDEGADAKRMEWLLDNADTIQKIHINGKCYDWARCDIDAAMEAEQS